jgi:hypothetical protein
MESTIMKAFPDWLGRDLLAGTLPWELGLPASLESFLDRFTLHDAVWIGLYTETERNATLILRWTPPAPPADPHLLAIRFEGLERADVKLKVSELENVVSGPTSRAADWHRTQVEDRRGGGAALLHAPSVRLLCLTHDRVPLALPVPAETV